MEITLAITGSSGVIYGKRLLEALEKKDVQTNLIVSPTAEKIIKFELHENLQNLRKKSTKNYRYDELGAPISSGSYKTEGMVIAPCSMKTLGSIANGITSNLITRAADVNLKERRKLVVVPRETPLHTIHLENMNKLSQTGATILPASPGFYHDPQSTKDLVDFVVGKILDQFDIKHKLYQKWKGLDEQK